MSQALMFLHTLDGAAADAANKVSSPELSDSIWVCCVAPLIRMERCAGNGHSRASANGTVILPVRKHNSFLVGARGSDRQTSALVITPFSTRLLFCCVPSNPKRSNAWAKFSWLNFVISANTISNSKKNNPLL